MSVSSRCATDQTTGACFTRFKTTSVEVKEAGRWIIVHSVQRPGNEAACFELHEPWAEAVPSDGDYFNIVWSTDQPPDWQREVVTINQDQHYFVLCPDLLVTPTQIAATLTCFRRAVLGEHVASFRATRHTVMGNIKHELVERALHPFQNGVSAPPNFETDYLRSVLDAVVDSPSMKDQIFSVETTREVAIEDGGAVIPALQRFGAQFCSPTRVGTEIDLGRGRKGTIRLDEVVATEEKILSPVWGLKGKPDVLVRARLCDGRPGTATEADSPVLFPLELKTGHAQQLSHEAQVQIYALLLGDRYVGMQTGGNDVAVDSAGLLLHISRSQRLDPRSEAATMRGIVHRRELVASLIAKRNELAVSLAPAYLRGTSTSRPPTTDDVQEEDLGQPDLVPGGSSESLVRSLAGEEDGPAGTKSAEERAADALRNLPPPLPPVIGNRSKVCDHCFEQSSCMIFHRAIEGGTAESSGLSDGLFERLVGHLSEKHLEYFRQWNQMIDLESTSTVGHQREIWTLSGPAREAKGRCISAMRLVHTEARHASAIERAFVSVFERHVPTRGSSAFPPCTELLFDVGDYVTLSVEGAHHALLSGTIAVISPSTVQVQTSAPLPLPVGADLASLHWRIDKDELFHGLRILKNSLLQLLVPESDRLRRLVIDLDRPSFCDDPDSVAVQAQRASAPPVNWLRMNEQLPGSLWSGRHRLRDVRNFPKLMALTNLERRQQEQNRSRPITSRSAEQVEMISAYERLNPDQRRAVGSALSARDYLCIHGMPGTGKTTTIAFLIRALRVLGCSVLVCAYTHTAVDNLLLKLQESNTPFRRLGRHDSVDPRVREHLVGDLTVQELKEASQDPRLVVGSTCLTASKHPLVQRRRFDYCIIDEAGQLTQPVCIGPSLFADVLVLVGDDQQLPPLVKSELAKKLGMDVPLLTRLSLAHPSAVAKLALQFRMNRDIMDLANQLVYKNQLRCGCDSVAQQLLELTNFPNDVVSHSSGVTSDQWLADVLRPERAVVFLNTDKVCDGGARERRAGVVPLRTVSSGVNTTTPPRIEAFCSQSQSQVDIDASVAKHDRRGPHRGKLENEVEAKLVQALVIGLLACGVRATDIGVISPYRSQLRLLRRMLERFTRNGLEVQTVDRYQGRDKQVIIVSLVRSNTTQDVGGLLRDWRRINVAFTRAMRKLIVIGSRNTLQSSEVFASFLAIVRQREWFRDLPVGAHCVFDASSAETATGPDRREPARAPRQARELVPPPESRGTPVVRNVCVELGSAFKPS